VKKITQADLSWNQRLIGCVSVFQRISKQKQVSFATF